jgi:hypothetical protein
LPAVPVPVISLKRQKPTVITESTEADRLSSWKEETRVDLDDAAGRIRDVIASVKGEPSEAQMDSVWRAYLLVEKSVVFVKVELGEENPGRLVKLSAYSVPDERQALQFALRNLDRGIQSFALGDFVQALKELRESRNYLRVLIRQKKLARARRARR